jgi:hypothetical protein
MRLSRLAGCALAAAALIALAQAAQAQLMIIGNDQKPNIVNGNATIQAPGKDTLSIVDMSKPANLKILATIPLDNTIIGPPVNLAITPSRDLALVADTMKAVPKDNGFAMAPDNRLFVVDLKANPPAVVSNADLGQRPGGSGDLAGRQNGAGHQPRRRHDLGALDRRQGGQGGRHGNDRRRRRSRLCRRHRARRQARARGQIRFQQGRGADDR